MIWWVWSELERAVIALAVGGAVCGAVLTLAALYAVPWLWSMIAPWLHWVTA
jgi:hypothetical protein